MNKETGSLLWTFTSKEGIDASPVIVNGEDGEKVFFGGSDGKIYGLETTGGKIVFEYDTGSAISGSAAVSENKIIFGTSGGLVYCFTGEEKK